MGARSILPRDVPVAGGLKRYSSFGNISLVRLYTGSVLLKIPPPFYLFDRLVLNLLCWISRTMQV